MFGELGDSAFESQLEAQIQEAEAAVVRHTQSFIKEDKICEEVKVHCCDATTAFQINFSSPLTYSQIKTLIRVHDMQLMLLLWNSNDTAHVMNFALHCLLIF